MLALAERIPRLTFDVTGPHLVVAAISALAVVASVLVHYEAMSFTMRVLPRTGLSRRLRIVGLILVMIVAHVVEIWLFGLLYWFLHAWPELGAITGSFSEGALDYVYFSVITFTTVGYGDYLPQGPVTILCGTEALVGISFLAWTASVTFLEMQRDWGQGGDGRPEDRSTDHSIGDRAGARERAR